MTSIEIVSSRGSILAGLAIATTIVAWASAFPLIRIGLDSLAPLPLAAARFGLAAGIAAAWLAAARPSLPEGRDSLVFLACGAIGIAAYNAFLNSGQQTVGPGAASLIINTSPVITAFLAAAFLKERYGLAGWTGTVIAFAGVAIIALGQAGGVRPGAGASLVLAAAVCQASYFVLQRPLVPRYGALTCAAYTILAGALLLSPWLPAAVARLSAAPDRTRLLAVAGLALVPSAIGYAAWTYALDRFGASRAANFLYLVPPTAMLLSFGLTGETPRATTLAGGTIAIAGVALVNLRWHRTRPLPSQSPAAVK